MNAAISVKFSILIVNKGYPEIIDIELTKLDLVKIATEKLLKVMPKGMHTYYIDGINLNIKDLLE